MKRLILTYKPYIGKSKEGMIRRLGFLFLAILFLCQPQSIRAQHVNTSVDTTSIRIGEQIKYTLEVEAGAGDTVTFPKEINFSPFEVVESLPIDTSDVRDEIRLIKEYALTKWDSGTFAIPSQKLLINEKGYFTESISVEVRTVVVDTTKQKLYPIKPAVRVGEDLEVPVWYWILAIALILVLLGCFLYYRRRKAARAKELPPYEQAIRELKELDDSHLLEERELKQYYSLLSSALRRYLDGEIYDHALESTTDELVSYLSRERDLGHLRLTDETIKSLKKILDRADLAKFANSQPDVLTAKEDRNEVEGVINDTRYAIPEPTEEDLRNDLEYLERQARKKRRGKIIAWFAGVLLLIGAGIGIIVATKGFDYFRDTFLGNQSKELLEDDWISSEYGTPPVSVTTPEVLVRVMDSLKAPAKAERFKWGSIEDKFFVVLQTQPVGPDFDLAKVLERVYAYLEERGARNIITKQEDFTTMNGAKGLRIFGTMGLKIEGREGLLQKKYAVLNFGESGGFQQILVIYNEGDPYADQIAQRIVNSVELRNVSN